MYKCQECGRKFSTTAAAERASRTGCPKCGRSDVDLDPETFRLVKPVPTHKVAISPSVTVVYPPR